MRRRDFLRTVVGSAAWPLAARAQQGERMRRVGFLAGGARPVSFESSSYGGLLQGLRELGYVEGRDFVMEWRFAETRNEISRPRRRTCAVKCRCHRPGNIDGGSADAKIDSNDSDYHGRFVRSGRKWVCR